MEKQVGGWIISAENRTMRNAYSGIDNVMIRYQMHGDPRYLGSVIIKISGGGDMSRAYDQDEIWFQKGGRWWRVDKIHRSGRPTLRRARRMRDDLSLVRLFVKELRKMIPEKIETKKPKGEKEGGKNQ